MAKRLYTEANVRELPAGSELVLGKEALATPAALELAYVRGVRVRWADGSSTPGLAAGNAAGGVARLLAEDGQYLVQVQAGKARVYRLGPSGPVLVGEGS